MCVNRTLTMKSTTFLYITDKVSSHHSITAFQNSIQSCSGPDVVYFCDLCSHVGDFVYCSSAPCLWPVPCQLQRWIAFCCQPTKYSSQWWIVALTDAQIGFGRTNQKKKKTRPLATASHHLLLCLCPKAAQGISPFVCSRPPINRKDKGPFRNLSHSYHSPLKWC